MPGSAPENACVEDLRRWLTRLGTGCRFARHLAQKALVHYLIVPEPLSPEWVRAINASLDQAAAERKTTAIIFPELHTSNDVVDVLRTLDAGPRWSARWVVSDRHGPRQRALVRLAWRTSLAHGRETSAMGLAPSRHMPLSRRAPYVTIVLWPGGRENARAPLPDHRLEPVGLVNAKHALADGDYDKHWDDTINEVRSMLAYGHDAKRAYREILRDVAFRLPVAAVQGRITPG